ncbi:MAG: response regulator [Syntrophobacteraceae bacterium]
MPIRLVLADAHPLMLKGLESLLTIEKGFTILAVCANGDDALVAVQEHLPDILILDVGLPGLDGLSGLKQVQSKSPSVNVVLYTDEINHNQVIESVRYGVKGIVLKEMAPKALVQCVRKVYHGSLCMDMRSLTKAIEVLLRRENDLRQIQRCLTPREIEIVGMVAQGLRNKEIGQRLFICEGTVKLHLHKIYRKLSIRSRMDLLRYAQDSWLA